ncbi:hypothetical protein A2U01_0077829, partial [Trifolium medium]|nr:hypothetical protein [Trifolium medium]
MNDRKGKGQDRSKPYDNKGNGSGGKKQGNGQSYKCGARGHMSYDCRIRTISVLIVEGLGTRSRLVAPR